VLKRGDDVISNRQKLILKAIIEIYVQTGEPVGSKVLTDWPYLDYSSATIRYDMQALEELGYLEKTHTSSGRVPSNVGYRYYLENLVTRDSEIDTLFPLIDKVFDRYQNSREIAVKAAIDLLSELTSYTSVALGPNEALTRIKKIDYVSLSDNDAVILIVTDRGNVHSQVFSLDDNVSKDYFKKTVQTLNELLENQYLKDARKILSRVHTEENIIDYMDYQEKIVDAFIGAFTQMSKEDVYLAGLGNMLTQGEIEDPNEMRHLLSMLNRQDVLKVVGHTNKLSFKIGNEADFMPNNKVTIISVPYAVNEEETGTIAIIGPTRMDYAKVIPLLEYIAKNITKLYKK
jgi:heat-inducible transcriptional repressor